MPKSSEKIHIILTGGTIDSQWEGNTDTIGVSKHTSIPKFFKSLELYSKLQFTEICMKDSRQLTPKDVAKICKAVEDSSSKKIIITHGTYTMPDTARYLQANLKRKGQAIILTGSMTPLVGFEPSDASFNLGYALAKVQALPAGVYLAMNGQVFRSDEVAKNLSEGRFYSVFKDRQ